MDESVSSESCTGSGDSDNGLDCKKVRNSLPALSFDIELDTEKWNKIKPIKTLYNDGRVYETFQKGWAHDISEEMWKSSKLQCAYKFKKHHVYKSENYPFFTFFGSCTDRGCSATFSGTCMERPSDDNPTVKIQIKTQDTSSVAHEKKRRFASRRRKIGKKELRNKNPKRFKVEEIDRFMDESDPLPALLSNSGVYQKARQEALDEEIGLKNYPGNVIESLHAIQHLTSNIHFLSTTPFQVMFWTESQKKLWKEALHLTDAVVSIDASGSFVKAIKLDNSNESPAIFLYVKVIRFGGKIYPVSQMLSAAHDTNSICDWLLLDMESKNKSVEKTIVVDCSLALLNAISLAYNECSYSNYLDTCFQIVTNDDYSCLPYCLIKRDRAHLIKNVATWKCFDGKDWRVKDFYTRCIAYSLNIEDFKLLVDVLSAMFIICQSTHCDSTSESFKRKTWLMEKIKTFDYDAIYENELKNENGYHYATQIIDMEKDEETANNITHYLYKVLNNCNLKCDSSSNNVHFLKPNFLECPDLVDNLITLYSQFPSWTNCMNKFYDSAKDVATSCGSECFFRILRREFNMDHPITANRFVLRYLKYMEGEVTFGRGVIKNKEKLNTDIEKSKSQNKKSNVECTSAIDLKNLSNDVAMDKSPNTINVQCTKVIDLKKFSNDVTNGKSQNKKSNVECTSTIDFKKLRIVSESPIIRNGIFIDGIDINNRILKFVNTCAIDAISEIILNAYCNLQLFKENVNDYLTKQNNDFLHMIQKFATNHSLTQLYKRRAQILLPIVYPDGIPQNVCTVDCVMNVTSLFDKVTKSFSNRLGYLSCINNKCMWKSTLRYQSKIIDSLTADDLNKFDDLVRIWFEETRSTCRKCKDPNAILNQTVGCYIALDIEQFYVDNCKNNLVNDCTKNVNNLPTAIFISKKKYTLVGVVAFRSNHYFACLRKPDFWEIRDDLKNEVEHVAIGCLSVNIALIIYIQS